MSQVTNPTVTYPAYYEQPFHAYPSGNLCMEAALEVTMAAKSVHAFVMDPAGKTLDPQVRREVCCNLQILRYKIALPRVEDVQNREIVTCIVTYDCLVAMTQGDSNMRSSYGARMLECMSELGVDAASLKDAVDIGCATGEVPGMPRCCVSKLCSNRTPFLHHSRRRKALAAQACASSMNRLIGHLKIE
eukprot:1159756-Pelagomonas_calceolata.AAC.4